MHNPTYNPDILKQSTEMNAEKAAANFPNLQAYFNTLTTFADNWHNYLYLYNPTVVIYGDDVRQSFVADMAEIRAIVNSLELTLVNAKMDILEDALQSNDVPAMTDGLKVFYASLKIVSGKIAAARLSDQPAGAPVLSAQLQTILAVDDKPELLTSICSVMRNHYKVIAVTGGAAALKAVTAHNPALFLLDIEMPGMDGYELAARLRAIPQFAGTPIIFLTGKTTREHVLNAMAHGGNDYLIKPVDSSLLIGKIQYHIAAAQAK